ncbi:unnamed protein product [Phytomonas sp. EM1]|nr:unnamed protein product [Phytomonas sp. EM1]|eukprot:CCW61171.1 unnamed protein product [Phytomonas sp. isolate EM1]
MLIFSVETLRWKRTLELSIAAKALECYYRGGCSRLPHLDRMDNLYSSLLHCLSSCLFMRQGRNLV